MHQLTENVKVLQKTVLIDKDKFLVLKRADDSSSRPGKWDLPGGNVEWPNSSVSVAHPHRADAVREVMEETGITVIEAAVTSPCYVGSYFEAEKQVFSIIIGWRVQTTSTEVTLSAEHTQYAWITPDQLNEYDFGFAGEAEGFIRLMVQNAFGS